MHHLTETNTEKNTEINNWVQGLQVKVSCSLQHLPWESKSKQRMVFGMINVQHSQILTRKVWSFDFLGLHFIYYEYHPSEMLPCSSMQSSIEVSPPKPACKYVQTKIASPKQQTPHKLWGISSLKSLKSPVGALDVNKVAPHSEKRQHHYSNDLHTKSSQRVSHHVTALQSHFVAIHFLHPVTTSLG